MLVKLKNLHDRDQVIVEVFLYMVITNATPYPFIEAKNSILS